MPPLLPPDRIAPSIRQGRPDRQAGRRWASRAPVVEALRGRSPWVIATARSTARRRRIEDGRPRFEASRRRREELARRFFAAAEDGDSEALIRMLAADVVAYGDGGGKAPAFPGPVHGRENVGRLLAALSDRRGRLPFVRWRHAEINGQPGAVFTDEQDAPVLIVTLDIADDQIQTIRAVANPDKLRHLAGS